MHYATLTLSLSFILCFGTLFRVQAHDAASSSLYLDSDKAQAYIRTYKPYAMNAMRDYGIPASIKLAQGMLESSFGMSELAQKGNNHFGIQCKEHWSRKDRYYKVDGNNQSACFRMYPSVEASYQDHSNFLRSRSNYRSLFDLPITDYVRWAHGLKAAGYAERVNYADQLISLIERYNLAAIDKEVASWGSKSIDTYNTQEDFMQLTKEARDYMEAQMLAMWKEMKSHRAELEEQQLFLLRGQGVNTEQVARHKEKLKQLDILQDEMNTWDARLLELQQLRRTNELGGNFNALSEHQLMGDNNFFPTLNKDSRGRFWIHGLMATTGMDGQSVREVAMDHGLDPEDVLAYNDLVRDTVLNAGVYIYLEDKHRILPETAPGTHVVRKGETMYTIAQFHGIKLKKLYQRNLMEEGEEPKANEYIHLKDKRGDKPALRGAPTNFITVPRRAGSIGR